MTAPGNPTGGSCPACGEPVDAGDGFCESCGRKEPTGRDHAELDLGPLAGVTDRGLRHQRNEDAMALASAQTPSGPVAITVVCDGVSSSPRPDDASPAAARAAVQVAQGSLTQAAALLKVALDAGGMDNITVVLAPFPLARPQTSPRRTAQ